MCVSYTGLGTAQLTKGRTVNVEKTLGGAPGYVTQFIALAVLCK